MPSSVRPKKNHSNLQCIAQRNLPVPARTNIFLNYDISLAVMNLFCRIKTCCCLFVVFSPLSCLSTFAFIPFQLFSYQNSDIFLVRRFNSHLLCFLFWLFYPLLGCFFYYTDFSTQLPSLRSCLFYSIVFCSMHCLLYPASFYTPMPY